MIVLPIKIAEMKEQTETFFVELYELHLKTGIIRLAAIDIDISFNGYTWKSFPIERGAIKQTMNSKVDNVEIKISNVNHEFTAALFQGGDFRGSKVFLYRIVYPDSLTHADIVYPFFDGELDQPTLDEKEKLFTCNIRKNRLEVPLPYRKSQLYCNQKFGDSICQGNLDVKTGVVQSATENVIYIPELTQADDYWKDGLITIGYETKQIISSKSGEIHVQFPFWDIPSGAYSIQRGCDKTKVTCKNRFNNLTHYTGFPMIPNELVYRG